MSPVLTSPFQACTQHQSASLGVVQFYLEGEGTVKTKGDLPALVMLVNTDLEDVPLTRRPPGARLHPGTEGGLTEGRRDPEAQS